MVEIVSYLSFILFFFLFLLKQVSEVGSILGRASTVGLEKAVEVLDTLGSSMASLNSRSGFVSSNVEKGNIISMLAFEVANTIVRGSNLMRSLSEPSMKHLKEVVFHSEGVQYLISKDDDELLKMAAADKRFVFVCTSYHIT